MGRAGARIAVLAVGEELLAGDIVDTNSAFIARLARDHGWELAQVRVVGDDEDAVAGAVTDARGFATGLVVTGGLGPTSDDLTRDGVARALGLGLERRTELVEHLEGMFSQLGRTLVPENLRQCDLPTGAEVLENPRGTAPGFLCRADDFWVACLPGVPSEMRPMVTEMFEQRVRSPRGPGHVRKVRLCGPSESKLGALLGDLMAADDDHARTGITASGGVLTVAVRGFDRGVVDARFAEARARIGDAAFGEDEATLASVVVETLAARGATVTTAESCTGGLLAGELTSVAGASAVFERGVVSYADDVKRALLGVPEAVLVEHGAVSEACAEAMARGARERAGADFALSVTGIAGPGGGTADKPVGTVCFGLAGPRGVVTHATRWRGARDEIRARSVTTALDLLRRELLVAARVS